MKNNCVTATILAMATLALGLITTTTGCASRPASASAATPAQVNPTISHQVLDSTSADGFWGKIGIPMGSIGALGFQFGVGRLNNTAAVNPVSNQASSAPSLAVMVGGKGGQSFTGSGGQGGTNAAAGMLDKGADFSVVTMGPTAAAISKDGTNGYSATVNAPTK